MQMNCQKAAVVTYHLTQEMCLIIEFASLANPSNIYICISVYIQLYMYVHMYMHTICKCVHSIHIF